MANFQIFDPYLFDAEMRRDFDDFNERTGEAFDYDRVLSLVEDENIPLHFFAYDGDPSRGWCLVGLEYDALTGERFVLGWLAYSPRRGSLLGQVYKDLERLAVAANADYVEIRTRLDKMASNCLQSGYCKAEQIMRKRIK
ncbi:hypothetical protein [Photobacterium angustum]|uniref:hypothetical protein n=1 Tax=Photobacterium angustum TaxID=661 RepID=UPI0005E99F4F|nr:hypothetical protein [Photobacterium angustum]KJG00117.1 hypothetical protein UB35_19910 [Photobacterium angustum]PSV61678.1 hypothetical protein CTM95_20465 [Photobacterium angustum]